MDPFVASPPWLLLVSAGIVASVYSSLSVLAARAGGPGRGGRGAGRSSRKDRDVSVAEFLRNIDPDCAIGISREGPSSAAEFFTRCAREPALPRKLVVTGLGRGPEVRYYSMAQPSQGRIFIDIDAGVVDKEIGRFAELGVFAREIDWLERLGGSGRTPPLVGRSGNVIRTAYRGEPLRHHNLPADWPDQAEDILDCLARADCRHNDIRCDNIVVSRGRMTLIDFGWATQAGAPIPGDWPTGLGGEHRCGIHQFDDRKAIFAACLSAAENRVFRPRPAAELAPAEG